MSVKTVAEKLLVKPGTSVWTSHPGHRSLIEPLPVGAQHVDQPDQATTAVVFAGDSASARALLDAHRGSLDGPANVWVAYPKANRADINRDTLWPILAEYGMRPIGQIAVDDTWSALRFRPLRDGEAPFTGGR